MAFADGALDENEMALIYDFGGKIGFPDNEVSKAVGEKIREDFCPKAASLK